MYYPTLVNSHAVLTMAKRNSTTRPLKQAIDRERAQLMQAHAVVKTLSAALMNVEDDDAMFYVDTANVAADLIDEAVGRLDGIGMGKGVREDFLRYVAYAADAECFRSPIGEVGLSDEGISQHRRPVIATTSALEAGVS